MRGDRRSVLLAAVLVTLWAGAPTAWAQQQILRPYSSPRVTGMGGVVLTTGMWDDNFYGNPAQTGLNPRFKVRIFDVVPMLETTLPSITAIPRFLSTSDPMAALGQVVGQPIHLRIQTAWPSVFIPARNGRHWGLGFGLTTSTQVDANLRASQQVDTSAHSDAAFHVSFAYKFLPDDILSIGVGTRFAYRLSAVPSYSLLSYFQGGALPNLLATAGDGFMVDGDVGGTFRLPWKIAGQFEVLTAVALNNVLGGGYSNIPLSILNRGALPSAQPRQFGFGAAIRRLLWGPMKDSVLALEMQDIGNTGNGSWFRLLHLGGETRWRFLIARAGINQGYFTAGIGVYFRFFTLDLATYGEEMGLNAGDLESRRFAIRAGFQYSN